MQTVQSVRHSSDWSHVGSQAGMKAVLSLNFTRLITVQKHMFLDVATVLRGQSKDDAMAVWTEWHGPRALLLLCRPGAQEPAEH